MVGLVHVVLNIYGLAVIEELFGGLTREGLVQELGENARAGAGNGLCLTVVAAIAEPDGNRILRSDTAEPAVLVVIRSTGLARGILAVGQTSCRTRTVGDNAAHDVDGRTRDFLGNNALTFWIGVIDDHIAVAVGDGHDALSLIIGAAVGDSRVCVSHLERSHRADAERNGVHFGQIGFDAQAVSHLNDGISSDGAAQTGKCRVRGHPESALDGASAVFGVVDVGKLTLGPTGKVGLSACVNQGVGVDALLDCGNQGEGLEGRTGLTTHAAFARCHVDLGCLVVLAADHGLDVTVVGINRHDGALVDARTAFLPGSCLLGSRLRIDVKGGDNRQASLEDLGGGVSVAAAGIGELVAHVAREVRIGHDARARRYGGIEHDGLCRSRIILLLRDNTVGEHALKNHVSTRKAVFGIVDRVVVGRRLRNADERSRLVERQISGALGVIALRRSLNAVRAGAVVDGVEVHQQDFVLAVLLLQLKRDVHLAHLALEGDLAHLAGEDRVADELLRNGGRALKFTAEDVVHRSAGNAHKVNAAVFIEAFVFGGNRALEHQGADLIERHRIALLKLELSEQRGAVGSVDPGRLRGVVGIGALVIRQVLQPGRAQRKHTDDACKHSGGKHTENGQDYGLSVLLLYFVTAFDST